MTGPSQQYFEFKDPENGAFELDGEWFRIASTASAKSLEALRASPLYLDLIKQGEILGYERLSGTRADRVLAAASRCLSRPIGNDFVVFAVERFEIVTYPWEWSDAMLRSAGMFTLTLREELLGIGLDLKDASALNIQFRGSRPLLLDVGSITEWRPHPSWNAVRQFTEHFVNPLAASRSGGLTAAEFWSISRRSGLSARAARCLMTPRDRLGPQLALVQHSTRGGGDGPPVEHQLSARSDGERHLALKATLSLTRRLRRVLNAIRDEGPRRTTWVNYGSRSHYDRDSIDRKLELARSFATRGAPTLGRSSLISAGMTASQPLTSFDTAERRW